MPGVRDILSRGILSFSWVPEVPEGSRGFQAVLGCTAWITERTINDVTILDLDGRLTIGDGAELLRDTVKKLVSQGKNNVLINLTKVPYVDSGGLGELVHCSVSAKKSQGAVKLMGLASKITDLLAITRLVTVFDTFETERDAVASFAETPVPVRA